MKTIDQAAAALRLIQSSATITPFDADGPFARAFAHAFKGDRPKESS
jgi:hypothetical protein